MWPQQEPAALAVILFLRVARAQTEVLCFRMLGRSSTNHHCLPSLADMVPGTQWGTLCQAASGVAVPCAAEPLPVQLAFTAHCFHYKGRQTWPLRLGCVTDVSPRRDEEPAAPGKQPTAFVANDQVQALRKNENFGELVSSMSLMTSHHKESVLC